MSGFSRSVPLVFIIEQGKRQQPMRNYENSDPVQESKPLAMLDWFGHYLIKKPPSIKRVFFFINGDACPEVSEPKFPNYQLLICILSVVLIAFCFGKKAFSAG